MSNADSTLDRTLDDLVYRHESHKKDEWCCLREPSVRYALEALIALKVQEARIDAKQAEALLISVVELNPTIDTGEFLGERIKQLGDRLSALQKTKGEV